MSVDNSHMKLGKGAPRIDTRTLKLSRYATADLVPSRRIDWAAAVQAWGMMKNDELGNCAVVGPAHMIQAWTANNGNEVVISDADVVQAYSNIGGYVPGNPDTDNGLVMLDMLNYWRRHGIAGHKIGAFVGLTPRNRDHVALSVDLLGGCALGVDLPLSAQDQEIWSVPTGGPVGDASPGSWGGHMVPVLNYGPAGVVVVTWGKLLTITWEFFSTYVDEAYGVLSPDWATGTAKAPSGFNYAQLQEDLREIAG